MVYSTIQKKLCLSLYGMEGGWALEASLGERRAHVVQVSACVVPGTQSPHCPSFSADSGCIAHQKVRTVLNWWVYLFLFSAFNKTKLCLHFSLASLFVGYFLFAFYWLGFILFSPVIYFSNIFKCQGTHPMFTEYPRGGTVVLLFCWV